MRIIFDQIRRKWMKLRLQPIRVYCMHHVCANFDAELMYASDWVQIDEFKSKVLSLRKDGVKFISLKDAYRLMSHDIFRRKKYAVLTFDDGWTSLKNIIPWLCEQHIPVTLFVNPAYILNIEKREKGNCLVGSELDKMLRLDHGCISLASHGWNHTLCTQQTIQEFEHNVNMCIEFMGKYDRSIPFFAYPNGRRFEAHDKYLLSKNLIPVYMDGKQNYNNTKYIHRELM